MNMWNVHRMSITHIDNIGIPKHKKHLRLLSSGTKLFITFGLKGFWHKERGAIFLCWLFHLRPPITCSARSAQIRLASPRSQSQLTDFSQLSAHASGAWRPSHPWSHLPLLLWHLWVTRPLRACVNTCGHYITLRVYFRNKLILPTVSKEVSNSWAERIVLESFS